MLNNIEKILYLVSFLVFLIIRKYYTAKYKKVEIVKNKKKAIDIVLLSFSGMGMLIPLVYVFSPVFDFANYDRPFWLTIIGVMVLIVANILLWFSHHNLGSNWTPTLAIKKEHKLVNNGVYKFIRHPMYAAHIYWALGQIAILPNWIAGFSFIIFAVLVLILRIKDEENMMVEQFGDEYTDYMKHTGIIFPKIKVWYK